MFDQLLFCGLTERRFSRGKKMRKVGTTRKRRTLLAFEASRVLENRWSMSDRELPAGLLGTVFVRTPLSSRCIYGCLDGCFGVEPKTGFTNEHGHTAAMRPRGRLRSFWICQEWLHWFWKVIV